MAAKRSNLLCSKCKMTGFLTKRSVKDKVQIPKKISNLIDAWDYAAKICLGLQRNMIRFPPMAINDEKIANEWYDFFTKLCPHTQNEIDAFESRQFQRLLKRAKTKKIPIKIDDKYYYKTYIPKEEPLHLKLPENTGRITKSSIAWLYGSIVCTVLREISRVMYYSEEEERQYAHAVYRFFSLFRAMIDDRTRKSLCEWNKIMEDKFYYGTHAASALNNGLTTSCKNCSDIKNNTFVQMTMSKKSHSGWLCNQCGGTESIKRKLTTKHIRNKESKVLEEIFDSCNYVPLFFEFIHVLSFSIRSIHMIKDRVLTDFKKYEIEANRASFHKRERYFMGHYDNTSKKYKKNKWCSIKKEELTSVEINDKGYFSNYKPLIPRLTKALEKSDHKHVMELYNLAANTLRDLGWPVRFMADKINEDVNLFLNTGIY